MAYSTGTQHYAGYWEGELLAEFAAERPSPILDKDLVPLESASTLSRANVAYADGIAVARIQTPPRATGVTVLRPEYTSITLPLSWHGDLKFNGQLAHPHTVCLPDVHGSLHIVGRGRQLLSVALPRERLVEALATLLGVHREDVSIPRDQLVLPPASAVRLQRRLRRLLEASQGTMDLSEDAVARSTFTYRTLVAATDAYMAAEDLARRPGPATKCDPGRVVRAAEECYRAAPRGHVRLVDLCRAAGVGKTSLYRAFEERVGQPPLHYFRRRQLMRARSLLLARPPEWGEVKRAALESGFTHLGRFSSEYRQAFGEFPAATLGRSR